MKRSHRSVLSTTVMVGVGFAACVAQAGEPWVRVYTDNFQYQDQPKNNTTFNTWLWREDATGTHTFNVTDEPGCSTDKPCVTLTAMPDPTTPTPYINGEMYNNACARQGIGQPEPQAFDRLPDAANPLVQTPKNPLEIYARLQQHCSTPYPYRDNGLPTTPYAWDSWNTTTPVHQDVNPLAYLTQEPDWEWYPDLAFNTPYLADATVSQRVTMEIKAQGEEGGSRGWGFWNTLMDPYDMQFAWFMEIAHPATDTTHASNDMLMMTVRGGAGKQGGYCVTPITKVVPNYNVGDWHRYQVAWHDGAVEYSMDGIMLTRHTQYVPNQAMAFHNWADNRNYSNTGPANFALAQPKSNLIRSFAIDEQHRSAIRVQQPGIAGEGTSCGSFDLPTQTQLKKDGAGLLNIIKKILNDHY